LKLQSLLAEDLVLVNLKGATRDDILREMVDHLSSRGVPAAGRDLLERLIDREKLGTTSIGDGVAIPHAKIDGITEPILLVGLSRDGVKFDGVDDKPCNLFFLALSPARRPEVNLRVLAAIAKVVKASGGLAAKLLGAGSARDVLRALKREEDGGRA
jgi:PTS system nitrogen regulatory IIA component